MNVYEDQLNLISSEGAALEGANGAWHLELSETKHVYLTRRGPDLRLMFKEFTRESGSLRPSGHWVEMDKQQLVDFIFVSPDTIFTCRRNDITTVSIFSSKSLQFIVLFLAVELSFFPILLLHVSHYTSV